MLPFQGLKEWNSGAPEDTSSSLELQARAQESSASLPKNYMCWGKIGVAWNAGSRKNPTADNGLFDKQLAAVNMSSSDLGL